MQIQLKAKHFYFILHHVKNQSLSQYFSLVSNIKTTLIGNTDPEALFSIEVTADNVIDIFGRLTVLQQGIYQKINQELRTLLESQVPDGLAGVDAEEWGRVATYMQDKDINNDLIVAADIADGEQFLQTT